jgi:DNA recombination protein RmuC
MAEQRQAFEQREREFKEYTTQRDAAMGEKFNSLAADTLSRANKELLNLAETKFNAHKVESEAELEKRRSAVEQLVKPIAETLRRTDEKLSAIEKDWTQDRATLVEQLKGIGIAGDALRGETARLVQALREPHVRGRYGEWQLKRVAEIAGMSAHCDFALQEQTVDGDGKPLRPDMVVRLPGDRTLVVDAKANIKAYIEATHATSAEEAEECLERYAKHVADQAMALAKKKYWAQYDGSPEFVVMFVPGDGFLDAALSRQPDLLENAARQGVILASPATLIGLLRAVSLAFQEHRLAKEALELRELGRELHERASNAFENIAAIGLSLDRAVRSYNKFVGSYESRLEPTLKRFEDAGVKSGKDLPDMAVVEARVRSVETEAKMLPAE